MPFFMERDNRSICMGRIFRDAMFFVLGERDNRSWREMTSLGGG